MFSRKVWWLEGFGLTALGAFAAVANDYVQLELASSMAHIRERTPKTCTATLTPDFDQHEKTVSPKRLTVFRDLCKFFNLEQLNHTTVDVHFLYGNGHESHGSKSLGRHVVEDRREKLDVSFCVSFLLTGIFHLCTPQLTFVLCCTVQFFQRLPVRKRPKRPRGPQQSLVNHPCECTSSSNVQFTPIHTITQDHATLAEL